MKRPLFLLAAAAATTALSSGVAWAVDSISGAADQPTETAVRVDPPTPAVVIGDSAIAALRWVPGADNAVLGFDHTLDLESCRRVYVTSCLGREGRRPPSAHAALADHGDKYHTLVVATGYNDSDTVLVESFTKVVERARQLGYSRIVWWTLRSDVDYVSPGAISNHQTFARTNQLLRQLVGSGSYPEVVLADWGGYTSTRREWFTTDGVHYRAIGAWAAADYLSRKMAFLDQRACPVPLAPTAVPQNPCPDPDVTGPVADIEALYPIGEDGVLCYEIGETRRIECRLDTHVLQLTRQLSQGMVGDDVEALQVRLQRLGFVSSVDGVFGTQTVNGVVAYQTSIGLPTTGVADRVTLDRLGFDVSAIPA